MVPWMDDMGGMVFLQCDVMFFLGEMVDGVFLVLQRIGGENRGFVFRWIDEYHMVGTS